ncbi:DUF2812 domain-containing protein [Streptococcus gallolyticus]|uniref:DUF2812 domain-containing protein n=1 Tax=Streptococcus hepaticus TaxID=3349163 RepID=UPI001C943560|nr:DUF2812 domain-containing protein [Streptococcus gallolyticus]MBY5040337.1 DUF2812 domain-containing protein [Streptococcus gallolyticus]
METKKEIKIFTFVDYDREEDYLRLMHEAGWKLTEVKLWNYYFEKSRARGCGLQVGLSSRTAGKRDLCVTVCGLWLEISARYQWLFLFS